MTRLDDPELLMATQLEQAGIPFEREYLFHPERKWRADFVVSDADHWEMFGPGAPPFALLIEIDGGGFIGGRHSTGTGIERDCEKQSAAAILGYRVLRVTPAQVNDGRALEWVKQAMGLVA